VAKQQTTTATAHAQRLRDYGREVVEERDALMEAAQGAVGELSALVKEQVDERPYTVLGAAFGLGLVLGGGLPLAIVGLGARAAAGMAMRQMVEGMIPALGGAELRGGGRRRSAPRESREPQEQAE
jgi:hypothetical protein